MTVCAAFARRACRATCGRLPGTCGRQNALLWVSPWRFARLPPGPSRSQARASRTGTRRRPSSATMPGVIASRTAASSASTALTGSSLGTPMATVRLAAVRCPCPRAAMSPAASPSASLARPDATLARQGAAQASCPVGLGLVPARLPVRGRSLVNRRHVPAPHPVWRASEGPPVAGTSSPMVAASFSGASPAATWHRIGGAGALRVAHRASPPRPPVPRRHGTTWQGMCHLRL